MPESRGGTFLEGVWIIKRERQDPAWEVVGCRCESIVNKDVCFLATLAWTAYLKPKKNGQVEWRFGPPPPPPHTSPPCPTQDEEMPEKNIPNPGGPDLSPSEQGGKYHVNGPQCDHRVLVWRSCLLCYIICMVEVRSRSQGIREFIVIILLSSQR